MYTVAVIHTPDMERLLTLLRVLINKRVEIVNVKFKQNGNWMTKRREDLTKLYLVNSILDIILSVAATVISSMLLLSGDIEQNPGPGKEEHSCNYIYSNNIVYCDCHYLYSTIAGLDYNSVNATQILSKSPNAVC